MSATLECMIAFRYLRSRKGNSISLIASLSLIGIALSVGILIVVMSVMNGFRAELTGKILGLSGHVSLSSYEGGITNYDALTARLREVEGVVSAVPSVDGQVMATTRYASSGALVKGLRPEDMAFRPMISGNIRDGSLNDFHGKDVVAIGARMAEQLGAGVGDEMTLISPQTTATALGQVPRLKTYHVVAIFEAGMYEYDSSIIYMPLEAAQLLFKKQGIATSVEIMVQRPEETEELREPLRQVAGGAIRVQDWQMTNMSLFNALKVERSVMFLILSCIVAIAAFIIFAVLVMLVSSRAPQIAILRTLGVSRGTIMRAFFLCGATLGVAGTLIGVTLGVSFALNIEAIRQWLQSLIGVTLFDPMIYFLSELPAELIPSEVGGIAFMAILFSFVATLYPSWKAARTHPVEALRYAG